MSCKPKLVPCPHDIVELLKAERQYMRGFGVDKRKNCRVWCDDCKHWVPFDWIDRPDDKGMYVEPTSNTEAKHGG